MEKLTTGFILMVFLTATPLARAEDWPQWRGPSRNGQVTTKLPLTANTKFEVKWRAKVGTGFSAISVADGRAYTMGNANNRDFVWCFDATTGKEVWHFDYPADLDPNLFEGGPTSTPTVANGKVFTLSRKGLILCFDAKSGKGVWSLDTSVQLKPDIPQFGFAGSALVVDNTAIFNVGSHGLALNVSNGNIVWRSDNAEAAGYNSPQLVEAGNTKLVLLSSGNNLNAVNPKTGDVRWSHPWVTRYGINAADPLLVSKDHLLLSSGYTKGASLVKFTATGVEEVWRKRQPASQMSPGVFWENHVYAMDGDTMEEVNLICIDPQGNVKWKQSGLGAASLIGVNDKLLVLSESGELHIVSASPSGYQSLTQTKLLGGKCWTPPTYCDEMVYARDAGGNMVAAKMVN